MSVYLEVRKKIANVSRRKRTQIRDEYKLEIENSKTKPEG